MRKITYPDKYDIVPIINKQGQTGAKDLNMIKHVVNRWIDDVTEIKRMIGAGEISVEEFKEVVNYIRANRSDLENLSVDNIGGLQEWMDGLKVGGVNLFSLSALLPIHLKLGGSEVLGSGFDRVFKCKNVNDWSILSVAISTPLVKMGEEVTVSFEYRRNSEGALGFELCNKERNHRIHRLKKLHANETDTWKLFTETVLVNCSDFYGLNLWGLGEIRRITVVVGGKFTGLFPSLNDLVEKGESICLNKKTLKSTPVDGLLERDAQGNLYFTNGSTRKKIKFED